MGPDSLRGVVTLLFGEGVTPNPTRSYSAAVGSKPKMITISTQTEVTNCQYSTNFVEHDQKKELTTRSTSTTDLDENSVANSVNLTPAAPRSNRGRSQSPKTSDMNVKNNQSANPHAPHRGHKEERVSSAGSQPVSTTLQRRENVLKGSASGGSEVPPDPG